MIENLHARKFLGSETLTMGAMTNVALPFPGGANANWTLIYTSAGTVTANVHNRTPDSDILVRLNGSSGTVSDALDAAAELVHAGATIALSLANGDLVFARLANANAALSILGRVTVRV
jgi:hypothetical protein